MDKNTLVGFVLIGAVIVGFGIYNRPSQEEKARAQHYQDSIQQLAIQKEQEALKAQEAAEKDNPAGFYFHVLSGYPGNRATDYPGK